jgi:hypothetical protein
LSGCILADLLFDFVGVGSRRFIARWECSERGKMSLDDPLCGTERPHFVLKKMLVIPLVNRPFVWVSAQIEQQGHTKFLFRAKPAFILHDEVSWTKSLRDSLTWSFSRR